MLPERMTAVYLTQFGAPLTVRQVEVPTPGPGEVLIRMAMSVINPSDLRTLAVASGGREVPFVPGLEGSGRVVAAGRGRLPRLLVGRRVAFAQQLGGAWAEYAICAAARCIPLRGKVSYAQAAGLIVNPLTALALIDIAKRGRHKAVVSTAAAGALGRMLFRLATAQGMEVINVVRHAQQAALLRNMGATYVLNSTDDSFPSALRALSHQLRATMAFDAVAGPMLRTVFEAMPAGSELVPYGVLAEEPVTFDARSLVIEDKRLSGFYLGNYAAQRGLLATLRDIIRVQRLVDSDLQTTIHRQLPLIAAQEAVALYRQDMTSGKVLLVAGGDLV
jgi:NADPH:quinone reductase-like Zn-dependent oxidoreductase